MSATPPTATKSLSDLYESDETAWLEAMAELAAQRRTGEIDYAHLSEYLSDMARRDRREVRNRLTLLLAHLLKWESQLDKRTSSWQLTLKNQRRELRRLLESGTLRNYALSIFEEVYQDAREQAAIETALEVEAFPKSNPYTLDELLAG